ncbi:hypothetical protein JQC92_08110 [Shewanella sp. 202IG2-18]|uniref:hypothetical protein n=1 Tax=Parashewanella hymeniacidonis TaxID=2807618 RepID=UPI00195F677E|nr:hypothetical protein [Parashewanella hymeniacidonis]MBM7071992.1 hypothetical protein [Parashewanella hymeniacidonis]
MAGIISIKLLGATPKVKFKFKPKAKLPKTPKASKSNSPKNIHKKDPANGVTRKKKISMRLPQVLSDAIEPLELMPKYHIEAKLFDEDFSFWGKIPTLIRYIMLKTTFIREHKGTLSLIDSKRLLKTAAHLERLLGAILNQSIPQQQIIMLEPFANLKLSSAVSPNSIINQLKSLKIKDTNTEANLIKWLNSPPHKNYNSSLRQCYQTLIQLCLSLDHARDDCYRCALNVQVLGMKNLKQQFNHQWHKYFDKLKSRQAITFTLEVSESLPLFNHQNPNSTWYVKFEAIVSFYSKENLKVLFRFSAGPSTQNLSPIQTHGQRLLSGRHLKFFSTDEDAVDYLSTGFLLNLCHPCSRTLHQVKPIKSPTLQLKRTELLRNMGLQQHIIHQASARYTKSLDEVPLKSISQQQMPFTSTISQGFHYGFSRYLDAKRTKVPLLNQLLQEPLRLTCRNPQYFTLKIPHKRFGMMQRKGDLGFQWVKNITKKIGDIIETLEQQTTITKPELQSLLSERLKLKQTITALNAEYHAYLSVLQKYEAASASNYPKYRELKQQFEDNRDSKCRAEYLRAVICTHALLVLAYHQSLSAQHESLNEPEINFCRYLSKLTQDYEHPDCYVVKEEADCYLTMTSVLKDTQIEIWKQIDLDATVNGLVLTKGNVVARAICDDIDPYMDGDYIDILLTGDKTHQTSIQNPDWLNMILQQVFSQIELPSKSINLIDLPEIDASQITSNTHIILQFKKGRDQFYDIQFIKLTDSSAFEHHQQVYATGTSIEFWLKQYNGRSKGHEPEVWQQFTDNNHKALQHLFDQIIIPNSHVANQVEAITHHFEDQSSKRNLIKAILKWKKSPEQLEETQRAFDDFLKEQYHHYQTRILNRLSVIKARLER